MPRIPGLLALTTLSLVLAACDQQAQLPAPHAGDTISLTLTSPLASLKPQGLPTGPNGASTVKVFTVKVTDAQGQPVTFDGQNVYQQNGPQTTLTLSSAQPSTTVLLPRGTYSFENIGKTDAQGTFLAYGTNDRVALNTSRSVQLDLHALADERSTTFTDKLGWTSVAPDEVLDLRLNVLNQDGNRVPSGDYGDPLYQVVDARGQPLIGVAEVLPGSSKLGARVKVSSAAATNELFVKASVQAWMATGTDRAALNTLSRTFRIAIDGVTIGLVVDTQAPAVKLNAVGAVTAGQAVSLTGTVNDDSGMIASLRVYAGSLLVGSTDSTEFGQNGVGELNVVNGAWSLSWTPTTSGAADLMVLATDKTGNEGQASGASAPDVTFQASAKSFDAPGTLTVSATNTDGLASIAYYVNGRLSDTLTAAPYTFSLPVDRTLNGTVTLKAVVTDRAGKSVDVKLDDITVRIDVNAPVMTSATLITPGTAPFVNTRTPSFKVMATDNAAFDSGIGGFALLVGSGTPTRVTATSTLESDGSYTVKPAAPLNTGTYTIRVVALDNAKPTQGEDIGDPMTVTVDTTRPSYSYTTGLPGPTPPTSYSYTVNLTETNPTANPVEYAISEFGTYSSMPLISAQYNQYKVTVPNSTIWVRARDLAGNVTPARQIDWGTSGNVN
ncbi:Ig-like domain-containing protein [Deinococcus navajonensis]|uniref:Ig-like domain-containing protein n=1 Tax=Deinococcus navajonensis TaxID=309884 RepID=A0ABV8XI50_9DEIO